MVRAASARSVVVDNLGSRWETKRFLARETSCGWGLELWRAEGRVQIALALQFSNITDAVAVAEQLHAICVTS